MKKLTENVSEIVNTLNSKRDKAYVDIYYESEFSGLGILIDEELNVYKYLWNTAFNKETNSFGNNNYLYLSNKKVKYEDIENYLLKDLGIIEKKYLNNSSEFEKYNEIIRLKNYVGEYFNKELYNSIKDKIKELVNNDI